MFDSHKYSGAQWRTCEHTRVIRKRSGVLRISDLQLRNARRQLRVCERSGDFRAPIEYIHAHIHGARLVQSSIHQKAPIEHQAQSEHTVRKISVRTPNEVRWYGRYVLAYLPLIKRHLKTIHKRSALSSAKRCGLWLITTNTIYTTWRNIKIRK